MKKPALSLYYKALFAITAVLLPILITFFVSFNKNKEHIINDTLEDLTVIAEANEGLVYQFLEMSRRRAEDFASDGFIRAELQRIIETGEGDPASLNDHLVRNKKSLDNTIRTINIISLEGHIVASTDPSSIGVNVSGLPFFERTKRGSYATEKKDGFSGLPEIVIATPISNKDTGEQIGVFTNIILLSELSRLLSGAFMKETGALTWGTGKRKTMDFYLVNQDKLLITESRFIKDASLHQVADTKPVRLCIEKDEETTGIYENYRGVEVLGASMCLPSYGWTLLIEMDLDEVLQSVDKIKEGAIMVAITVALFIGILFIIFNRRIVTPIKSISTAAREIAMGNYDIRIPVKSGDEIGRLSGTFNGMAGEIKATTSAYRESESRLANAQRIAHIGNWELDIKTNKLSWYYEVYRIFGVAPHEFGASYESFLSFVHPDDRDLVKDAVKKGLDNRTPYSVEHRIILPDGSIRFVQEQAEVLFDESGTPDKMIGTVQDITRRKEAENAIEKSFFTQQAISLILQTSLENIPVKEQLDKALERILDIPGLSFKSKGAIYLVGEKPDCLILQTQRGLSEPHLAACSEIPFGVSICGRAAKNKETLFVDPVGDEHDIRYEGMESYGEIAVPILSGRKVLGVISMYLEEGCMKDEEDEQFLTTVANTLAGIIEGKEKERELRKLSAIIEKSINIVLITNVNGNIEYVNPRFEEVTGYSREEVTGKTPAILSSGETTAEEYKEFWDVILSGKTWQGRFKNRNKNGEFYIVSALVSPIMDEKGDISHFLAVQEDLTEKISSEERIDYLVSYDNLTGLYNRDRFSNEMNALIQKVEHTGKTGVLLLVDIDGLKIINDTYGHNVGDQLIKQTAGVLKHELEDIKAGQEEAKEAIVGRLGSDEFAFFLPFTERAAGLDIAEQLRRSVELMEVIGKDVRMTVSIGVVLCPDHGNTLKDLLTKGDAALIRIREQGRNRSDVYRPEDLTLEHMHSRLAWKGRIQKALDEDNFVLWFQPIFDIQNQTITHYEVLVRMSEDGKILLPGAFINIAEIFGLVNAIDRVVTEKAMKYQAELARQGRHLTFSMNLSGKTLGDEQLLNFIQEKIKETGAEPKHLVFEITETAAIYDIEKAVNFIKALQSIGCHFSLDDFGVGFTSFTYLREMHVDFIKIDGSFIKNLNKSPDDQIVVKSITDVAKGMKMKTVAEFVENEESFKLLKELGVDYAQGYFIGKPSPDLLD